MFSDQKGPVVTNGSDTRRERAVGVALQIACDMTAPGS